MEVEEQSVLLNARAKLEQAEKEKKGRYSQIPEWVHRKKNSKEISLGAFSLYSHLDCFYGGFKAGIFPKQATLAEELGTSVRTVKRWVAELVLIKALTVSRIKRTRGGNFYVLEWFEPGSPYRRVEGESE